MRTRRIHKRNLDDHDAKTKACPGGCLYPIQPAPCLVVPITETKKRIKKPLGASTASTEICCFLYALRNAHCNPEGGGAAR